jgi:hypothetical protein
MARDGACRRMRPCGARPRSRYLAASRKADHMSTPIQPARLQFASGIELIEDWSRNADDLAKTAVYEVLFSIAEGSVFRDHVVVDDVDRPTHFYVLTGRNLAVKVQLLSLDTCAIVYIGPACGAPGLDWAGSGAVSPGRDAAAGA